jgi:hypothetical protein
MEYLTLDSAAVSLIDELGISIEDARSLAGCVQSISIRAEKV